MQTVVVPPGETNISKLLTALFIFIRAPFLKVGSAALIHYLLTAEGYYQYAFLHLFDENEFFFI